MTVTTITTVGYHEVHPLSDGGRIFSIFLMVGGIGGALYAMSGIVGYVVEGNIGTVLEKRKMQNRINKLKGHFILCGFGRVAGLVRRLPVLSRMKKPPSWSLRTGRNVLRGWKKRNISMSPVMPPVTMSLRMPVLSGHVASLPLSVPMPIIPT